MLYTLYIEFYKVTNISYINQDNPASNSHINVRYLRLTENNFNCEGLRHGNCRRR